MAIILLIAVYLVFAAEGLPNSLVQSAWPMIRADISAELTAVGALSFVLSGCNIVGSLLSDRLVRKLGQGPFFGCGILVIALCVFGYTLAQSFLWFVLLSIPLGLAAGAMDSGANNYVALYYEHRHMNWLHCAWSFGATAGTLVLSRFLAGSGWHSGFHAVGGIILAIAILLFAALPLWKRQPGLKSIPTPPVQAGKKGGVSLKGTHGLALSMMTYFFFCGVELTPNVWGSSFLTEVKGMAPADAAQWVSFYFAGITVGRILAGFATMKVSGMQLVRVGQGMALAGIVLMLLPLPYWVALIGLVLIGLGGAPIYPCLLKETPGRFGAEKSQRIISLQVAAAFAGSTLLPPVFGMAVSAGASLAWMPWFLLIYALLHVLGSEASLRGSRQRELR